VNLEATHKAGLKRSPEGKWGGLPRWHSRGVFSNVHKATAHSISIWVGNNHLGSVVIAGSPSETVQRWKRIYHEKFECTLGSLSRLGVLLTEQDGGQD
jgi:hypothetical protein